MVLQRVGRRSVWGGANTVTPSALPGRISFLTFWFGILIVMSKDGVPMKLGVK